MFRARKTTLKNPKKIQPAPVTGLYHKALFYFNRSLTAKTDNHANSGAGQTAASTIDGITEDEKQEIINEIDTLIAQKKTSITPELLVYKPEHLGFFLPLMINLLAGGIVVTAFLLLPFLFEKGFFERSKQSDRTFMSAESDIVEKFKQESAAKISAKEAELNSIQGKMSQLQKEKATLDATFNDQIRKKEEELKKSLQSSLEQEKQRLISQGITNQATMDAELKKLELQLKETNNQSLNSYKSEIQAQLSEKEKLIGDLGNQLASGQQALAKVQEQYQQQISAKENALKAKEAEIKNREAALLANYQAQKQQLESALGDASGQVSLLQKAQQQEQQVHNQLLGFYNQLDSSLKAQDYNKAAEHLKNLEDFLTKKENANIAFIQERKPVELFITQSLKEYIALKQSGGNKNKGVDSGVVESIVSTVKEAQQAFKKDDKQKAYKLYTSALEKIPEIKASYSALQAENDALHKNELEKLASQITDLKKKQAELEENTLAMTNELSRLKSQSGAIVPADEKRKQLTERLGDMKQQYLNYIEKIKITNTNNQTEEYSLIQSKLTLKKILTSKTVTSQYPELYQDMDKYFNNLDDTRTNWRDVTVGLMTVLDYLNGEVASKSFKTLWPVYQQESQQNLMLRYLTNLQAVFKLIQAAHVKKLDELSNAFNNYLKSRKSGSGLSETEMYNLVMAKLVVKKILATEPYATQYPDLYQNLEKYTALLEQEQTQWQNCFQELVYLASRLNEGFKPAELAPHWQAFQSPDYKELILTFINTLQAIL